MFPIRYVLFLALLGCSNGIIWYEPQQVHIAAADTPDKMVIVWNTGNDTGDSRVLYGKSATILNMEATGTRSKFVDGGLEKRAQYIHRVTLSGLAPRTQYWYMVGSKAFGFSDEFTFRTWPTGVKWSPNLALYGDMGNENAQSLPRLQMDAVTGMYDAILHVGDIAYNMDEDNARVGDEFMRQIEPLASRLPYMMCPGNHEERYNFSNYKNRFWMPGDENKKMYYSFNMGPIHFVSIATELWYFTEYGLAQIVEQYKWLERDLAEASKPENRAKQPWIITFGHRPMYCSTDDKDDCRNRESLVRVGIPYIHLLGFEKLFFDYGVDLELWAHEHTFERLWPVYNREVKNGSYDAPYTNPRGPVHIITGSAGCRERTDNFAKKDPWSAFRTNDYGYTRMKVFNSTHLYLEQVSDDKGGAIVDKMMLIKENHGPYPPDNRPVEPVGGPFEQLKSLGKVFKNFGRFVKDN